MSFAQMTDTGQALLVAAAVRSRDRLLGRVARLLRYDGIRVDTPAGLHMYCTPGGAGQRATQVARMCGGRRGSSGLRPVGAGEGYVTVPDVHRGAADGHETGVAYELDHSGCPLPLWQGCRVTGPG